MIRTSESSILKFRCEVTDEGYSWAETEESRKMKMGIPANKLLVEGSSCTCLFSLHLLPRNGTDD